MAKTNVSVFYILLIISSLLSKSQSLPSFLGFNIGQVTIRGLLRCSLTGDPNAPPVSGSTVTLRCANQTTNLGQAVTDPTGVFNIVAKFADTTLFDPSHCAVDANLPAGTCSVAPPDGTLTASISLVNYAVSGILGFFNFTTGPFLDSTL